MKFIFYFFQVIVNGLPYTVFVHRTPVEKVNTLRIVDDVFINMFAVVEVSHFPMMNVKHVVIE